MVERFTSDVKNYIANLAPSGQLEELVAESAQLEGLESASSADTDAKAILEKVTLGAELTPTESFALEAIIIPDKRPAIDVLQDSYQIQHSDWVHLNDDAPRTIIERAIPSIGRVEVTGHPRVPYGGTGFVVADDLMMTNRHVAELFATGLGQSSLAFITGRDAGIDFLKERGNQQQKAFDVSDVLMIHPYWDMALLRVPGIGAAHPALKLGVGLAADKVGREVAVIGYPGFDRRNPADVQNHVFDGTYYVKRLQPGKVRGQSGIESYRRILQVPTHDASTLGGNSGSAVIDVETGEVVGLHFAGRYLEANYFVDAGRIAEDARVVDAGVSFAGVPQPVPGAWDTAWANTEEREQATGPGTMSSEDNSTPQPVPPTTMPPAPSAGGVTVTLPLHITVSLGTPGDPGVSVNAPPVAPTPVAAPDDAGGDGTPERTDDRPPRGKPFWDDDYSTRKGFETDFLGIEVPLPTPKNPNTILDAPDGGKYLHYHHFSLAMHKERRLAAMSAAMVDFSDKAKTPGNRPPKDYTRDGLAGRSSDAWFEDERIKEKEQLPNRFFTNDDGAFDRGHVVRRDDIAWGATYSEMRNANGDSFHSTNCSPQVSGFNQATRGRDNWGDLEEHVEGEAEDEKLVVFAGPVFKNNDRRFDGIDNSGSVRVQIPESYWKLIIARKGNQLRAFGFELEQDLTDVDLEFFVPKRWRRFMVSVDKIERLSGFEFASKIHTADQFETLEGVMLATRAGVPPKRDAPTGATEAVGGAPDLTSEVAADWRDRQGGDVGKLDPAIFVVELDVPMTDETIGTRLREALDLDLSVEGLFESDGDLDRFREVTVPGIGEADRADLFDIAAKMKDVLSATSVEPDLGSRYFDGDVPPPPATGTEESASAAFWCWVPEDEQGGISHPDWAVQRLKLPEAWARSDQDGRASRGKDTVIFQPDTGVVPTHRELPRTLADHPKAANFIEPGQKPIDPLQGSGNLGHGTATGSVVASPETYKVRGAAPATDLVPIRALRSVVRFEQSRIAKAVNHARLNGAHVITMSLGGVPSRSLRRAVQKAVAENIIVMAAAGNCVGTVVWPAKYREVIAVAGSNDADRPWRGSSAGRAVDITAPGEFVLRADATDASKPGKVGGGQGTSFAVALTAGVAACWLSHHGRAELIASLKPGETLQDRFRAVLQETAQPKPGLDPSKYGPGLPNAEALLDAFAPAGQVETVSDNRESIEAEVVDLFAEIAGDSQESAAILALQSGVSSLELATLALDKARYRRHATLESLPPASVSSSFRMNAGDAVTAILTGAAR